MKYKTLNYNWRKILIDIMLYNTYIFGNLTRNTLLFRDVACNSCEKMILLWQTFQGLFLYTFCMKI